PQANLVFAFGERTFIENGNFYPLFNSNFPNANIVFCSTSGEIMGNSVNDDTLAVTAVNFEKTLIQTALVNISGFTNSKAAGKNLVEMLPAEGLRHIFVLSDGGLVNGSDLVEGMSAAAPAGVGISGGLAGDGARFEKTLVGLNNDIKSGNIVAIGLYGNSLIVGCGSNGGWDSFGPYRQITRSKANVLYELEGKSALELYKQYLGNLASGLPGTALLFPLSLRLEDGGEEVVRTILSVNEADQSMTFAGNMPEGAHARLMKANFDRLIDAAAGAAEGSYVPFNAHSPQLAILVSCVGRKLVLNQRVDEEVESVRHKLGAETAITGFYSYGEISPFSKSAKCQLHNQTMTITAFSEV
ncbi:MAG TPA: FIST N-terminal domain-containing protein, partial [Chitinophagales bacterium]|nr:FIST N-terminal domain-containing protein [Chitinophagales bacterium]